MYKINKRVGQRIKALRKKKGLSQEELASRAKIHRTYMGKIERGESNPPLFTLYKIAKAIPVHISELFKPPLR